MSKKDILRIPDTLEHIVEAIERIHLYVEDCSEVDFPEDKKTQDAVVRNFEVIGEAARNIEFVTFQLATENTKRLVRFFYFYKTTVR